MTLPGFSYLIFIKYLEAVTMFTLVLQVNRLRLREVNRFVQILKLQWAEDLRFCSPVQKSVL